LTEPAEEPPAEEPQDAASAATPVEPPVEESRIIIRADGQVIIENLSALLAEVASALDPEAELACRLEFAMGSVEDDEPPDP
jgi:hypothetical protein